MTSWARKGLEEAIQALKSTGAEIIILGCTELPIALTESSFYGIPLLDPTTILARAIVREVAVEKLKPLSNPGSSQRAAATRGHSPH